MTDGLGLDDVYGATIERIEAQGGYKSRLGMGALMWVSYAEVPLNPDELCHALAIDLGSTDFNADNIPSVTTLVSCCQGLITVDKEASTVRLIHFTLREYLSTHSNIFSAPHSAMAEICLTYLNSEQVKALSADSYADLCVVIHDNPFLEYCSLHWGVHAKREFSDCSMSLALQLFRDFDGHISRILLWEEANGQRSSYYHRFQFSPLHCASVFGIVELLANLIKMECYDINEGDDYGFTPLAWAAQYGHDEMVKMLVESDVVDLNKPDIIGQTPLLSAAKKGHEVVVKILLGREEINPDAPDDEGFTPLLYAAQNGHEAVVKILLGRDEVNPDKPDNKGRTPLVFAAQRGHEGVVRALLGREEVNPDRPDNKGRTPLSYAAENRYAFVAPSRLEEVVKILLQRDEVNPHLQDSDGRTPLSRAVESENKGVAKILLEREEDTLTGRIMSAEHRSRLPQGRDLRGW